MLNGILFFISFGFLRFVLGFICVEFIFVGYGGVIFVWVFLFRVVWFGRKVF